MILNNAKDLNDVRVPPGNRLEALSGTRRGPHSLRINAQWRICFVWKNGDASQVEITDSHEKSDPLCPPPVPRFTLARF